MSVISRVLAAERVVVLVNCSGGVRAPLGVLCVKASFDLFHPIAEKHAIRETDLPPR